MNQWEALKQYELRQREQQQLKNQELSTKEKQKELDIKNQHISFEQRRLEAERQQELARDLLKKQVENRQNLSLVLKDDLIKQSSQVLKEVDSQRNTSQKRALELLQQSKPQTVWRGFDGKEFRSPREAEFWNAWNEDQVRANKIQLVTQYKIGRFCVDFAHILSKTAIELDGRTWHTDKYRFTNDRIRQRELEKQGWSFVRFSGDEISENVEERVREVYEIICRK